MDVPGQTQTGQDPEGVDPFGLVGAVLNGTYEVGAVVAEGGFGVVYHAIQRDLLRPVALKVLKIPPTMGSVARREFLDKFTLEARTIAKFDHPAIVRVIDFGASPMPRGEAAPWMVLEWLEGVSLEAFLIERGSGFDPIEALALLEPALEAIAYAHEEGVAHRDLKPANLMLVRNKRGNLSVRVLDFGIAKRMEQEEHAASGHTATRTATQAFTLPYAAPEQLTAMRTGPWTDVHALALIMVEMLTGLPPIAGNDVAELYASALSPLRPTPGRLGVDVGAWEVVLAQALAFKPAERFPDARSFLAALRSSLPGACVRRAADQHAPFQQTLPAEQRSATLRGTSHPTERRGSRARHLVPGVVGGVVALILVGGSYLLAIRGPSAPAGPRTAASTPSTTSAPPAPTREPPLIVTPIVPEASRDAGSPSSVPAVAPTRSADRTAGRTLPRGAGGRAAAVRAPTRPRPASSSEQLPVE